ncbi:MAG: hypothetical protein RIQ55_616 [Pseudomonadota bacterium]|jgi:hypothetical protein
MGYEKRGVGSAKKIQLMRASSKKIQWHKKKPQPFGWGFHRIWFLFVSGRILLVRNAALPDYILYRGCV